MATATVIAIVVVRFYSERYTNTEPSISPAQMEMHHKLPSRKFELVDVPSKTYQLL